MRLFFWKQAQSSPLVRPDKCSLKNKPLTGVYKGNLLKISIYSCIQTRSVLININKKKKKKKE